MNALRYTILLLCPLVVFSVSAEVQPSALVTNIDTLINLRGKANPSPLIAKIVSTGDDAVGTLTNRLEQVDERMPVLWIIKCLCQIGSDASLAPVQTFLQDTNHNHLLKTANQSGSTSEASLWCLRLTSAIRMYPIDRESEILPDLIRLSDPEFGGMVHYYATERLRKMIRRKPSVAGRIVDALDDRPERERYSRNLGEIIAAESGHANHWGVFGGPSDPNTIVARSNSIWRDWWGRNKDRSIAEWKAEAQHISATIPKIYTDVREPSQRR